MEVSKEVPVVSRATTRLALFVLVGGLLACSGLSKAPRVDTLTARTEADDGLGPGDSVTFTARVLDPDGADDVLEGWLADAKTGAKYGDFVHADTRWTLTLTSEQISSVERFEFDEQETRDFEAVFMDGAGHESPPKDVAVTLHCDGEPACGGQCTDFGADADNCGECGHQCPSFALWQRTGWEQHDGVCADGSCVATSDCGDPTKRTCGEICEDEGFAGCPDAGWPFSFVGYAVEARGGCAGDFEWSRELKTCDEELSDISAYQAMYCICVE